MGCSLELVQEGPGLAAGRVALDEGDLARLAEFNSTVKQTPAHLSGPGLEAGRVALDEGDLARLAEFNSTVKQTPAHLSGVHQLISQSLQNRPAGVAVEDVSRGATTSCAELDDLSTRLAIHLVESNQILAGCESSNPLIALQMRKSTAVVICILGVWKAGGAYVPLDPEWPSQRRRLIVEIACCRHLITDIEFKSEVAFWWHAPCRDTIVAQETLDELRAGALSESFGSGPGVLPPARSTNLAYVYFTSGSTGEPKGVMITHASIASAVFHGWGYAEKLGCMHECLRWAQPSNYVFDVFVYDLTFCLSGYAGGHEDDGVVDTEFKNRASGTLVLIDSLMMDIEHVAPLDIVSTVNSVLAEAPTPAWSFKVIDQGGECLTETTILKYMTAGRSAPAPRMVNSYGPTECTVNSNMRVLQSAADNPNLIGPPVPNVQCYVVDHELDELPLQPIGQWGELLLGGVQVALGYIGKPDLTKERFLEGLPAVGGGRLYRTGDVARWTEHGDVEFGGRIDLQVKLRGLRIELGEIEQALGACSGVELAVATVVRPNTGEHFLCAYVSGPCRDVAKLKAALRERLPRYMVPDHFVWIESWPRLASGKIDRKSLPRPQPEKRSEECCRDSVKRYDGLPVTQRDSSDAAERQLEVNVATLFASALKCDVNEVLAGSCFLDLGGTSVAAMRLSRYLQSAFPEIKWNQISAWRFPTASEMAEHIRESAGQRQPEADITPRGNGSGNAPSRGDHSSSAVLENFGPVAANAETEFMPYAPSPASGFHGHARREGPGTGAEADQHGRGMTGNQRISARGLWDLLEPFEPAIENTLCCFRRGQAGKTPIVFVHGAAGLPFGMEWAHRLSDKTQPVYAFQSPELLGGEDLGLSLRVRVERYFDVFRRHLGSSVGAHLVGYSAGCCISRGMCFLFQEAELPFSLTLIDPPFMCGMSFPGMSQVGLALMQLEELVDDGVISYVRTDEVQTLKQQAACGSLCDWDDLARALSGKRSFLLKLLKEMCRPYAPYRPGKLVTKTEVVYFRLDLDTQRKVWNRYYKPIHKCELEDSPWSPSRSGGWIDGIEQLRVVEVPSNHNDFFWNVENESMLQRHLEQEIAAAAQSR